MNNSFLKKTGGVIVGKWGRLTPLFAGNLYYTMEALFCFPTESYIEKLLKRVHLVYVNPSTLLICSAFDF